MNDKQLVIRGRQFFDQILEDTEKKAVLRALFRKAIEIAKDGKEVKDLETRAFAYGVAVALMTIMTWGDPLETVNSMPNKPDYQPILTKEDLEKYSYRGH